MNKFKNNKYKIFFYILLVLVVFDAFKGLSALCVIAADKPSKKLDRSAVSAIITQYGDPNGSQSSFYTIEPKKGGLIVVDGGWALDASKVRKIIENKGKIVDAWIITHPHPDHVGAFNEIYKNKQGIKIKKIFTVKINYAKYRMFSKPWDEFQVYKEFRSLVSGSSKLKYLKQGDTFAIRRLNFKVFNAYDSYVCKYTKDLCNGGSLMFKVYGKKQSMLFCSDVGAGLSNYLLKKYGKELKADYLQMGHHGNGGLKKSFYKKVKPKKAYFDAPNWLMNNKNQYTGENADYKTKNTIQWMKEIGAKIYSFKTSPNKIILK